MKKFYAPREVQQITGLSYRQIQYWDKTDFIKPSFRRNGKYRCYTFSDLLQLEFVRILNEEKFSVQCLRAMVVDLRELLGQVRVPLSTIEILVDGKKLLLFAGEYLAVGCTNTLRLSGKKLFEKIEHLFPDTFATAS